MGERPAPQKLAVGRRVTYLCFSSSLCEDLFRETENRAHCTANHRSTGACRAAQNGEGWQVSSCWPKAGGPCTGDKDRPLRSKPRPGLPRASRLTYSEARGAPATGGSRSCCRKGGWGPRSRGSQSWSQHPPCSSGGSLGPSRGSELPAFSALHSPRPAVSLMLPARHHPTSSGSHTCITTVTAPMGTPRDRAHPAREGPAHREPLRCASGQWGDQRWPSTLL